jgi:hypothetical protein
MKGFRVFVAIVLGLFMVGFGICAGCGALIVIQNPDRMAGVGWLVALVGLFSAMGCFFGMRALLRKNARESAKE